MDVMNIRIEHIQAGQPRAYADSIYESILTYTKDDGSPDIWAKDLIKQHAKLFVHSFNESEDREWWEGSLDVFEEIRPGRWKIRVIEPYTD